MRLYFKTVALLEVHLPSSGKVMELLLEFVCFSVESPPVRQSSSLNEVLITFAACVY